MMFSDYNFHVIGFNTMFSVAPTLHSGYILSPRGKQLRLDSTLRFLYSERRKILLNIYYMYGQLTIGVEVDTSHTSMSYCIPINQGDATRVVNGVTSNMTLAVSSCGNDGRFMIGFSGNALHSDYTDTDTKTQTQTDTQTHYITQTQSLCMYVHTHTYISL